MHNTVPLIIAALTAIGIIVIGCFYIASQERVTGSFGLKPPAAMLIPAPGCALKASVTSPPG